METISRADGSSFSPLCCRRSFPDLSLGTGFVQLVSVASKMLIPEVEQMSREESPFTHL